MRRFTAIVFCTAILPAALAGAQGVGLLDISTSPYRSAIEDLVHRNVVSGYDDGTYRPLASINRAELIKILMESRWKNREPPADLQCFKDLETKIPQWYAKSVCKAAALGIVSGYPDGTFKPDTTVNLAEALKMTFRSFGIVPSTKSLGNWYEPYLEAARNRGLLLSLLKYPGHLLTRGEMASLTSALFALEEDAQSHGTSIKPICGNGVQEASEQCDDGNTLDSDGCSSICLSVPEPIRRAILQIDQRAGGTVANVAQGQMQIPLLKFTAAAARQDALLTSVTFEASVGSLYYGRHFTLSMDRTGDGIYETVVQADGRADNGYLIFDHLAGGGVLVPKDLTVPLRVTADLPGNIGPVTIALSFATGLPEYATAQGSLDGLALEGVETNGACSAPNCFIRVNTQSSTSVTVQDRGNLYVSEDSVPTRSHVLLGSVVSDSLLRLRFRSDGEDVDIKRISFENVPSSVNALLLYSVPPGSSMEPKSSEPFARATRGQCPDQQATKYCAVLSLSTFIVRPSEERSVVVAAEVSSDTLGAVSGQTATIRVSGATDTTSAIEARGISSKQDLLQNNGNAAATGEIFIGQTSPGANIQITSRTHDISLAKISDITRDGPATESFIPPGFSSIGAFRFAAAPHANTFHGSKDVILTSLTFHVTAQNVLIDPASVVLSTKDDLSSNMPCSANGSTGSFDVTCNGIDTNAHIPYRIGQGQWVIYVLQANVANQSIGAGPSTLLTELTPLANRSQTNAVRWSDGTTAFSWVDVSVTSVAGTTYGSR